MRLPYKKLNFSFQSQPGDLVTNAPNPEAPDSRDDDSTIAPGGVHN